MKPVLVASLASAATLVTAFSVQADSIVLSYNQGQTATCEIEGGTITISNGRLNVTCSQYSSTDTTNPVPDADADGVPDAQDLCPNTPAGQAADSSGDAIGCSADQKTADADGDGFADYLDPCPDTTPGATVVVNGCEQQSSNPAWGQLENGTSVTWEQETSGQLRSTVYVPNKDTPDLVIYEGVLAREIIYPGCADLGNIPTSEWLRCGFTDSLGPNTVIAQRIRPGAVAVNFSTFDTGDRLNAYDIRIADLPLPEALNDPNLNVRGSDIYYCGVLGKGSYGVNVDPDSTSSLKCKVDQTKTFYAMFRPTAGAAANNCGFSTTCRMRLYYR